ncbi:MAG: methyltransferase domain-containing protein [Anaerolineales bacterium]|nr:methyltransferase domain-containing protein [Anaerolineales bacterium]
MNILDVGCGNAKTPGAVGIDANPNTQADIIHDLNVYPWPLAGDSFDRIICSHIVEHITNMVKFMEEVHRLGKPGARVEIVTPHFSNRFSFADPTHLRHLSLRSFDYFVARRTLRHNLLTRAFETQYAVPDFYVEPLFCLIRAHLRLARPFRLVGLQWLANRFPDFYELYLAFIFPARDLYVDLEVLKSIDR